MSGSEGGPAKRSCPQCGKPASGNFCQHCGASMGGRFCNQCGSELDPGARFCNQCGKPVGARTAPAAAVSPSGPAAPGRVAGEHRAAAAATFGGSNLPWWVAGFAMFTLILVVGWSAVRGGGSAASPSPMGTPGGNPAAGASNLDLSTMTPREAADRLFNHVMTDISQGDTADAVAFQPMAVQAYERAEPLDLDGLFHMSLLQRIVDPAAALATAQRILDANPDHILGLGAAAEAAAQAGQPDLATQYYKHLLDVYDDQAQLDLPAYEAHRNLLPEMKTEAEAYLIKK